MPRNHKPTKRIRVRSKALDEIDETKLALAYWLLAKRLVEKNDSNDEPVPPEEP